jgi:REP element-mobilizing transposase RayT
LPHWNAVSAIQFVTFNLFDAIPLPVVELLALERRLRMAELERLKRRATAPEILAIDRRIRELAEDTMDEGSGSCFMRDRRVAQLIADAITHFDGSRYHLCAWCVMPNHVHAVLSVNDRLDRIVHSWKSFTANQANRILKRDGKFWQDDYFDRMVRTPKELERTIAYVVGNPMKAGFVDWPFVSA